MEIKKLVLLTNHLNETKHFYSKKLNLEILEERGDFISLKAGTTVLAFFSSTIPDPVYHFAFNIPDNKIEEALEWSQKTGLKLLLYLFKNIVDFPNWNAKSMYFLDNNGNILEFIARHDLQNGTESPFNHRQILSVSEIGMVVDDVSEFCKNTNKEFAIPYYEKQKPAPDFSVMGDAEGLMIVVPEKRNWFPTDIPSKGFTVEITFRQEQKEFSFKS